jgi:hypothetical protein
MLICMFQSVVFIILLLLIVSYVYALVGVIIFQTYSQSVSTDTVPDCFRQVVCSLRLAIMHSLDLDPLQCWFQWWHL